MYRQTRKFTPYKQQETKYPKSLEKPRLQKPTELDRQVFFLNSCGSKQVILAHDSTNTFCPVITIEKAGGSGIRLSQDAFIMIQSSKDYINEFFSQPSLSSCQEVIMLTNDESLEFKQQWGNSLMVLKTS